jgi:Outer membrane protein beta-barrel domain
MRKFLVLMFCLGLVSVPLMAQDRTRAEVFGGYQFSRIGGTDGENLNGWNASVAGYFTKSIGVAGDFSGSYKSISVDGANLDAKIYTYTFGPVVALNPDGKVNPFVHALFGGARLSGSASFDGASGSGSMNGFTMMFGGGVDAKLTQHLAFRVVQADWAYYRFSGHSESKNARISTGIVFRF